MKDIDAMVLVVHGMVDSETESLGNTRHAIDLIEAKSPSIAVSVNQIDDASDSQDTLSDLTSFIVQSFSSSKNTDDGALMRVFEEPTAVEGHVMEAVEDHVMEARDVTSAVEDHVMEARDVTGKSHLYTETASFSSPHTSNSPASLSVSSPSLTNPTLSCVRVDCPVCGVSTTIIIIIIIIIIIR